MSTTNNYIKGSVIKLDNEFAVLKFIDGQTIRWQKNKLPGNLRLGDILYLTAKKNISDADNDQRQSAIGLLEEILNGESEQKKE